MSRLSHTARANRLRRFGVVATLAWLNLAMLPCTMAASDAPGCPECPPVEQHAHEAHAEHGDEGAHAGGHHAAHGGGHQAGNAAHDHELAGNGSHCGVSGPDCCELDDLRLDDRSQKHDRDIGAVVTSDFPVEGWRSSAEPLAFRGSTGPPRSSTGAVRLHAFNCVYRD